MRARAHATFIIERISGLTGSVRQSQKAIAIAGRAGIASVINTASSRKGWGCAKCLAPSGCHWQLMSDCRQALSLLASLSCAARVLVSLGRV